MKNPALDAYIKAMQRFDKGTSTNADDTLLALWDEKIANDKTIREMAQKISMLEMRSSATVEQSIEYAAILQRLCNVDKAPLVQGE